MSDETAGGSIMSNRTMDIAAEIKKLQALATDGGELTPEMIADTLDGLEGMLEDKFDATMSVIRQFELQAEGCASEANRLTERKKHWERQAAALKKYLLDCLIISERQTLKTTLNTFTARKGVQRLVIDNIDAVPDEFVEARTEIIITPLRDQIKQTLQEAAKQIAEFEKRGEAVPKEFTNPVPGARLESSPQTLSVR
ncbi:siphovirus Gp157 family protein [Pantoea osteomyelitidis]|uniref:Siphovirus Gp157 family protein n=1 Tax=Pantoea osteomyelitidis TaxID=3230026 RepID=A0ABW7PWN1_9GAMM